MDFMHGPCIWERAVSKALTAKYYCNEDETSIDVYEVNDGEPGAQVLVGRGSRLSTAY